MRAYARRFAYISMVRKLKTPIDAAVAPALALSPAPSVMRSGAQLHHMVREGTCTSRGQIVMQ